MYNNPSQKDPNMQHRKRDQNSFYTPSNPPNYLSNPRNAHDSTQLPDRSNFAPHRKVDDSFSSYAPQRTASPASSNYQNGLAHHSSQAPSNISHPSSNTSHPPTPPVPSFYNPNHYQPSSDVNSNSFSFNPHQSFHSSPARSVPNPPLPSTAATFAPLNMSSHPSSQSSFLEAPQQQYRQSTVVEHNPHSMQTPMQPNQQHQPQHPPQTQFPNQVPMQAMQNAVPYMLAGMQQMATAGAPGANIGAQLFQSLAPGAAGYTNQLFGQGQESLNSFMRMPKYYFTVNHKYVLKKLLLILAPFRNRTWGRHRGIDQGHFEGSGSDGATSYLPPRDDVNAPDLYIPLMSFITYVLMVGFVFGMQDKFRAEILARYFSKGLAVLSLEVLIIKLGLYLINARPTPWLDAIAYRGYKFVGVVLTMLSGILVRQLYYPVLLYTATAMGIFLMRSHRRIILPRDTETHQAQDLARRNAFLLFLSVLQYPVYGVLVLDIRALHAMQ